ncbi:MAG: tetratricopeptide repeat protein [Erysipelotrichaceae bacterium]|nr:tetratricopeptide repeat protein [Erysipelotrichaceae bacterium]
MNSKVLKPEDYVEPECVICDKPIGTNQKIQRIPQQRISQKLDELMGQEEYGNAERMLKYWISEARACGDKQGEFMVYNEMMGFYRKLSNKEKAYEAVNQALGMLDTLEYADTVSGATCYTNAATVYTAFSDVEKSLDLFQKARIIYEDNQTNNEFKLAGLYNNMAIALVSLNRFSEADKLYHDALRLLDSCPQGELEKAITYLNMVDAMLKEKGINEETENLAVPLMYNAQLCLDSEELPRNSYYAFVADKCYPIFEYFQWYDYAEELKKRIRGINERA